MMPCLVLVVWLYVSEYRKRDLMAQKTFFELSIQSYSTIFELSNKLLSVSLPKRKAEL